MTGLTNLCDVKIQCQEKPAPQILPFVRGKFIFSTKVTKFKFLCVLYLHDSRNSSVGRALDWRSKGPWFNPGFRQSFLNRIMAIFSLLLFGNVYSDQLRNFFSCLKWKNLDCLGLQNHDFSRKHTSNLKLDIHSTKGSWYIHSLTESTLQTPVNEYKFFKLSRWFTCMCCRSVRIPKEMTHGCSSHSFPEEQDDKLKN